MRTILTVLCLCLLSCANATTYYLSSSSGDDSRSASTATNPATPWRSIDKINASFGIIKAGDQILFKRGDTFYGTLKIPSSGTSGSPIVIGAYGTGDRPILTGLTQISGWSSLGNGIYESTTSLSASSVNMVVMNGAVQQIGRYPNITSPNKGYLTFETFGSTFITDNELTSATNFTGAELVVRTSHWTIDRRLITSHSGTTISYNTALTYTLKKNFGYFIQNHIKTLDQPGEWYYNTVSRKLYIYSPTNPSNVKVSTLDAVVFIQKQNYVTINDLKLEGGNIETLRIEGSTNIIISNCDIEFSGTNAVRGTSSTNIKIDKCAVNESNNNALDLRNSVSHLTITNNSIANTGTRAGMGLSHNDTYQAIIFNSGSNHLIEYNTIENTGYNAIRFNGSYVMVKNNLINKFCFVKDDGAGIYTYNSASTTYVQRKIIGNIILNGLGANEGTDNPSYFPSEGIYMDNNVMNVEISGNTISNCNKGILNHNSSYLTITNNTLYNNKSQLYFLHDNYGNPMRNNVVTQNLFFSRNPSDPASSVKSELDDIQLMGRFDSNYYCRPINDEMVIWTSVKNSTGTKVESNHDLTGWQYRFNKDLKSKKTPTQIPEFKLNGLSGSNRFPNGNFNTTINGIYCSNCTSTWNGSSGLDGGHAQITTSSTTAKSSVSMGAGSVVSSKTYLLRFSAKGNIDLELGAYLRQGPSPYTSLTPMQYRKVSTARDEFEILFTNPNSASEATLMLVLFNPGAKLFIDNIQLFEANVTLTKPDDYLLFEYNGTKTSKTVALNGTYIDVKNKIFANTITIEPFNSVVLIRKDTITTPTNSAPKVAITDPLTDTTLIAPDSIQLLAHAVDDEGTVRKVEFYRGTTLLGIDSTLPFSISWKNPAIGTHQITAKAFDSELLTTVSLPRSVKIVAAKTAPSIRITSPETNSGFLENQPISLTASATDQDGRVERVEFYNGTTLIGYSTESPYNFSWTNIAAGTYNLTARAIDNDSLSSNSDPIKIVVSNENQAPNVSILEPLNGATLKSTDNIVMLCSASDPEGTITKVDFYIDGQLLGSSSESPYRLSLSNLAVGSHELRAKAYDQKLYSSESQIVRINIVEPIQPSLNIASPVSGEEFEDPAKIFIQANTNDSESRIKRVEFYNGSVLIGTDYDYPFAFSWNNIPAGSYTIIIKGYDAIDIVATSEPVTISVIKPNIAPAVSIESPTSNSVFNESSTININVAASDVDGQVKAVKFYSGATLLGIDYAYPFNLNWERPLKGNHYLSALAIDDDGDSTLSTAVPVGISPIDSVATISVGPNPATNKLSIYTDNNVGNTNYKISILSQTGLIMRNFELEPINAVISINIAWLKTGTYFLQISYGNTSKTITFLKI